MDCAGSALGAQESESRRTCEPVCVVEFRLTTVLCETPFRLAVTVAVWLVAIWPEVAVKVAVSAPCETFSAKLAGTVSRALLLDSVAVPVDPPAATTVHVVEAAEASALGEHEMEEMNAAAERLMLAVEDVLL